MQTASAAPFLVNPPDTYAQNFSCSSAVSFDFRAATCTPPLRSKLKSVRTPPGASTRFYSIYFISFLGAENTNLRKFQLFCYDTDKLRLPCTGRIGVAPHFDCRTGQ